MDDAIEPVFDFEADLQRQDRAHNAYTIALPPGGNVGQQPRNFVRNYKKTVCIFWLKGMCMKGDACGFLHEYIEDRLPECTNFLKFGFCSDPDCKLKHSIDDVKECNMYALGFCIYGPSCRFRHTRRPGPPPHPSTVEACKPKAFRDINKVVNAVNDDVAAETAAKRPRLLTDSRVGGRGEPVGHLDMRAASRLEQPHVAEMRGAQPGLTRPPRPPPSADATPPLWGAVRPGVPSRPPPGPGRPPRPAPPRGPPPFPSHVGPAASRAPMARPPPMPGSGHLPSPHFPIPGAPPPLQPGPLHASS